ncbi:DMT family transporter [Clostridium sp. AN503]|uniref:DMT family transporter n=1 Tax=Clostridium sp. AN503 TaxID=3160598 RepID=UPI0034584FBE
MWGFLIALISGALMSIQGVLNTEVTKQTGIWVSAGWVQLTAFLTCIILYFFADKSPVGAILEVRPWYMLAGGVIGAFITYTVIRSMDGLGPAKATLLIVITQIIVAYGIELFGLFGVDKAPFEWKKVIGALIAIAGIVVFRW